MAREKAQAAQQAYATAKAQGNVSQERLAQLQNEADEASKIASNEEQLLGQKKKKLEEYAITSVLRTPASLRRNINVQPDQALVENVENALQSIEESKRNQDTYNRMMVELKDENLKAAYRTGNITDCDTLDAIQTALKTIKGQRDREIATLETMSGTLKASSQLDSAKAADGTSGK